MTKHPQVRSGTLELPGEATTRRNLMSSRALTLSGWVLSALLLAAVAGLVGYQRGEDIDNTRERHEWLARVLEDHASRVIDAASMATAMVADGAARSDHRQSAEMAALVRQSLASQSTLRALGVLSADGQVLAAAGTLVAGTWVEMSSLGPLPEGDRARLATYVRGRDLPQRQAQEPPLPGLGVLPFVRHLARPGQPPLYVVALINPDVFANFQEQTLRDSRRAAAMLDYDGRVVAATDSARVTALQSLADRPPLTQFLPAREHGSWVGPGLGEGTRVAAFRSLRHHPLLVFVDVEREAVTAATYQRMRWFVVAGVAAAALLLGLSWLAARTQRSDETARQALDAAQAALAARGRELSVVFASVRELLFRTDAQGAVNLINARWELATGRPLSEALGQPLSALVAPLSRDAVSALFEPDPNGSAQHAEVFIDGPQGRLSRFELTVVPLFEGGRLVGFAGSGVDMTELLATQQQLRSQLAFNASVIESNPLPMAVLDTLNRYVRVNRAWESFTGRSRDRVIGTLASLGDNAEVQRLHRAKDQQLYLQGGEVHYETQAVRADGSLRDVFVSKALTLGGDARPTGIVSAFMDVSEFREAERATRLARDAAEHASMAKSAFIANISHELRTPLQSILGFSELGARSVHASPRTASLFQDVYRSGQRMLALVNDLLDLSKLDRPGLELDLMRQDLRDLVQDVCAELAPLASAKQLSLRTQLPAHPLVSNVDGPRLQQVIRNLLANAIRFSPTGTRIDISAAAGNASGDEIALRVADEGPGVPADEREAIFEPFVQSSRTRNGAGGTGLGLAISRRIVRAHGGRIEVQGREPAGTVFAVCLPAARFGETRPSTLP